MRGQSFDVSYRIIWLVQHGLADLDPKNPGYVSAPPWLVQIEFPWRVMFGTLTTYSVAWCFRKR